MDKIVLSGIECYAFGGVSDAEKKIGQRYRLDLELSTDLRVAAGSDTLDDAVHYGNVHDVAVGSLRAAPFNLIEAAAERIAATLLTAFPVQAVTVRLSKLLPPIDGVVASAAVVIERGRTA